MIVINIDNGQWYECNEVLPAVVCTDWDQARAAEKEWNAWHTRLRAFFKENSPEHGMTYEVKATCHDSRRTWVKENPPPFWTPGGWPEAYCGDQLCDYCVDSAEIPIYTPKDI